MRSLRETMIESEQTAETKSTDRLQHSVPNGVPRVTRLYVPNIILYSHTQVQ